MRLLLVDGVTLYETPLRVHLFSLQRPVVGYSCTPDGCQCTHSNHHLRENQLGTPLTSGFTVKLMSEYFLRLRLSGRVGTG